MIRGVYYPLHIPAGRWLGIYPMHHYAFRGLQIRRFARSRASGSRQGPVIIIREAARGKGGMVFFGGLFLLGEIVSPFLFHTLMVMGSTSRLWSLLDSHIHQVHSGGYVEGSQGISNYSTREGFRGNSRRRKDSWRSLNNRLEERRAHSEQGIRRAAKGSAKSIKHSRGSGKRRQKFHWAALGVGQKAGRRTEEVTR